MSVALLNAKILGGLRLDVRPVRGPHYSSIDYNLPDRLQYWEVPRFRPKAMLERSAMADVFKNTLSRIPTLFGRLSYLASLRDPNTGWYEHHGLRTVFGRDESRRALFESHLQVFAAWNNLPIPEKAEDLQAYIDTLGESNGQVLRVWRQTGIYRTYIPVSAGEGEKALFIQEFEVLMEILGCG